jgi:hypothetical protein
MLVMERRVLFLGDSMVEEMLIVSMDQIEDKNLSSFVKCYVPINGVIYGFISAKYKERI